MEPGNLETSVLISLSFELDMLHGMYVDACNNITKDVRDSLNTSQCFVGNGLPLIEIACTDDATTLLNSRRFDMHIHVHDNAKYHCLCNNKTMVNLINVGLDKQFCALVENHESAVKLTDCLLRFNILPSTISSSIDELINLFENSRATVSIINLDSNPTHLDTSHLGKLFKLHNKFFVLLTIGVVHISDIDSELFHSQIIEATDSFVSKFNNILNPNTILYMSDTYSSSQASSLTIISTGA